MFSNKLVSSSRHLLGRKALVPCRAGEAARWRHVVCVPPRVKIPAGEMLVSGLLLVGSMWFIPYWVLYHLPDYQKEDRNAYTGK